MWWGRKHWMGRFGWLIWPLGWVAFNVISKGVAYIGENPVILGVALALAIPFLFMGMGIQLVKGWQQNNSGPIKRKNEMLTKHKNDDEPRRYIRSDDGELIEIT